VSKVPDLGIKGRLFYIHIHRADDDNRSAKELYIEYLNGLMVGVTGQRGMLTPPWHLIPPLIYSEARVSPFPDLYFQKDL
jgi:hypothetical protein